MKKINLLLFFVFLSFCAQTQTSSMDSDYWSRGERLKIVRKTLNDLRSQQGILIVRLPSNHRKIVELEKLANSPNLSPEESTKMKDLLVKTKEMTPAFNIRLMSAFKENYKFSKVLFMHDTSSVSLKNGLVSGFFLDKFAQKDASIQLQTEDWSVLSLDYDGFPKAINLNDFDMLNKNLKKLPRPFPQDARTNVFVSLKMLLMKNSEEKQYLAMSAMIKKYNAKLYKAYAKY